MLSALASLILLVGDLPEALTDVGHGPALSPVSNSWEVELKFLDPQRIEVQAGGRTETYWYIVYAAVNKSADTQRFYPTFQIVTENLHVHDTDMGISPAVFAAIKQRHQRTHPYLVSPTQAIGELRVGDDNARESVAIWRQIDLSVNNFTVYVAGLSGETRLVRNPSFVSPTMSAKAGGAAASTAADGNANPRFFTLRKTLEIRYTLPASPVSREISDAYRREVRWVLR
ncbi:MAG: hypothetical protein U1D55_02405 [Phycisphaerae bacterium]